MLPNYLANIKSAGIYRFVWDKSEMPGTQAQILRLVVGYSEKGPFNTPVYVTTEAEFKQIFGGVSKKMERYGVWFHRLAIQALKAGPILVLNLKNFEGGKDGENEVDYTMFDPNESIFNLDPMDQSIEDNLKLKVKDLYNTDRFWKLEPEHLEELFDDGLAPKNKYITLINTDSKDTSVTVFMRGYEPQGFDVPIKEWYSAVLNGEDVPSYLEDHENDLVSQYFAELYIFKGEFTPQVAASDKLAKFFEVNGNDVRLKPYIVNAFGEKVDTLAALANNDASNFVKSYSGILLPEFRNANNIVISLDAQVNADNYTHKLMMRLNQSLLYDQKDYVANLDTTGWVKGPLTGKEHTGRPAPMMSLIDVDPIIYKATFGEIAGQDEPDWSYEPLKADHAGLAVDFFRYDGLEFSNDDEYGLTFEDTDKIFAKTGIKAGDSISFQRADDPNTPHAEDEGDETLNLLAHVVKVDKAEVPGEPIEGYYTVDGERYNGEGEPEVEHTPEKYAFESFGDAEGKIPYGEGVVEILPAESTETAIRVEVVENDVDGFVGNKYFVAANAQGMIQLYNDANLLEAVDIWVSLGEHTAARWTVGNSVFDHEPVIDYVDPTISDAKTVYRVQFDVRVDRVDSNCQIYKCMGSITATSANLKPCYLKGYVFGNSKPASTSMMDKLNWQHHILDALTNYRGIRLALTNRVDVDYRYLIDTFESFVEAECKGTLANLVMSKDNTLGILNFPKMSSFSKCKYTSFRNEKNEFLTKYVAMGGNPLKPMSCMFTLPSQENGASWVGFFSALALRDPNTGNREEIPSAALVSNDFMQKYTKYLPYTIIAGPNRGVIRESGLIGPDFNFSREDLDVLEPFGVNCMVYEPRKGTYINSNQTAKQNPVTALSRIHVRELCIYLQDEIEKMLTDYHWDFNTPNLQNRIKDRADVILENCKLNEGIYDYLNQCDGYNNTDDVVNNEMLILSTSIEPAQGAGKMVQELTIYRKGGMKATYTES